MLFVINDKVEWSHRIFSRCSCATEYIIPTSYDYRPLHLNILSPHPNNDTIFSSVESLGIKFGGSSYIYEIIYLRNGMANYMVNTLNACSYEWRTLQTVCAGVRHWTVKTKVCVRERETESIKTITMISLRTYTGCILILIISRLSCLCSVFK